MLANLNARLSRFAISVLFFFMSLAITDPAQAQTALAPADKPMSAETAPSNQAALKLKAVETDLADFPKGMTSFGATVVGNQIYVIGGKSGKAHAYAKSYQNQDVFSLAIDGER